MARSHYRGTVYGNLTTGAKPLPGAAIRLYHPDTGQPWALPVYPDPVNGVPYTLPILTNPVGELELWADEPARVACTVSHPRYHGAGEIIEIRLDPGETATDTDLVESVADHEAKEDPHDQYLTEPEGNLLYKPLGYEPDLTDYYTRGEADDEFLDQDEADLRYEQLSRKGMPSGYAPLDFAGFVPNQYLPPLAITETFVCVSEAEMLALPAQQGDVAVRLDTTENYILRVDPATVLANWTKLAASTTAGNTSVLRREEFTPSPLATTVTLAAPPTTVHAVSRNGVGQSQPAGHYSLSGLVLTFTDPFELGERVAVVYEIGSTVPAPVNGYTKEESDLRYEPIDTMYTKGESDLRYALMAHNHTGTYLPLTGGDLSGPLTFGGDVTLSRTGAGALRADAVLGISTAPLTWYSTARALQVGTRTALFNFISGTYLGNNTYIDAAANPVAIATAASALVVLDSTGVRLQTAPSVAAGASQIHTDRLTVALDGMVTVRADVGVIGLRPFTDNYNSLGGSTRRWSKLWAVDGEFTNTPTVGGVALPTSAGIAATYLPLVGGTLTGNLGMGIAPHAGWHPSRKALQLDTGGASVSGSGGSPGLYLRDNGYINASAQEIASTNYASNRIVLEGPSGTRFETAPVVAVGAIQSWAERMRLDQNGQLGLGIPPATIGDGGNPRLLHIHNGGAGGYALLQLTTDQTGDGNTGGAITFGSTGISTTKRFAQIGANKDSADNANASGRLEFWTANGAGLTKKMVIQRDGTLNMTPQGTASAILAYGGHGSSQAVGTIRFGSQWNGISWPSGYHCYEQAQGHLIWARTPGVESFRLIYSVYGVYFGESPVPYSDNAMPCGSATNRWTAIYATSGAVNASTAALKEDFGPLDPLACAQAVLETDWVEFRYRPPTYQEPSEEVGLVPEARQKVVDEGKAAHAKMLLDTAPTRHQKGYVLQSPTHKVADLFGLDDRQSASPGSDLAVVACALQLALTQLTDLKAEVAELRAKHG